MGSFGVSGAGGQLGGLRGWCTCADWCHAMWCRRYLYDMTSKWMKGNSDYKLDKLYMWNAGEKAT